METLTEQIHQEKLKSFDLLAGVNSLRHDLDCYSQILPRTFEQVRNEQLSYIAEGIDKASRSSFVFERSGDDLIYFDDGHWRPYSEMLEAGLAAAIYDAAIDPRREFLVGWARSDILNHEHNIRLQPGEKRAWASPYPQDVEDSYGKAILSSCGVDPERKMGYLYQASCTEDGIVIESQSIDRSDIEAFSAALQAAQDNPELELEQITQVYDRYLADKYGGTFYAGRRNSERSENAWRELINNQDLVDYLMSELTSLASMKSSTDELETSTKRLIYGIWAAFSRRLSGETGYDRGFYAYDLIQNQLMLEREVDAALNHFAGIGKVMIGCGGSLSIKSLGDLLTLEREEADSLIFSSKKTKTETLRCVHCPLCNQDGVDAKVTYSPERNKKTITCTRCKGSKTYAT